MPRKQLNEIDKRRGRDNIRSSSNHYEPNSVQNRDREFTSGRWDDQSRDDYDKWSDDRVTYAHGHNYRSNSARQGYYKPEGSDRNYRQDDFEHVEENGDHPYHRPLRDRNVRKGSRAIGDQGGDRYPDRSRAYGNDSGRGYGGGFYGGRQGWDSNYGRDSYDWDDDRGFLEKAGDEVRSWFGDDEAQNRRIRDGHAGRGPSNYTRSDIRITEDVNDRLTDDFFVDASNISVTVTECEVTLDGTVQNKLAKRRAEDCVDTVSGVKHVQNNLRVE